MVIKEIRYNNISTAYSTMPDHVPLDCLPDHVPLDCLQKYDCLPSKISFVLIFIDCTSQPFKNWARGGMLVALM